MQADSLPSEPQGKPKNTGEGSLSLRQWIFLTQESNRGVLHYRWILYQLSYQGNPHELQGRTHEVYIINNPNMIKNDMPTLLKTEKFLQKYNFLKLTQAICFSYVIIKETAALWLELFPPRPKAPGPDGLTEEVKRSRNKSSEVDTDSSRQQKKIGTSWEVWWLRLCTPNAGGMGLIPDGGLRCHMLGNVANKEGRKRFLPSLSSRGD